ncbi:MAG: DNA repair exonuclease [Lachnospiraceae bacterium]|jgi:exonuclease SbcD|nr:DNA repair exonuclease [Lachnospiraceae bacterium]
MRFFHTADIHLGAVPDTGFAWSREREKEIWESFRRLIGKAKEEQIDLLLIAGDLFHRQPLLRELKEVNYLFSGLSHTKVVLIAGNHDYLKRDSYYHRFSWNENVLFLGEDRCGHVEFKDIETSIYGFSYASREIREPLYDSICVESDRCFKILLAHGGDEKHIPIDRRKLMTSGFDYIALGHIHKPQVLVPGRAAYAGALEPLERNDTGPHGYLDGVWEGGRLSLDFVPWACREYVSLEIGSDERQTDYSMRNRIVKMIEKRGKEHIYKIRISGFRDPDIVFHTEVYSDLGNIVEVLDDSEPAYDFGKLLESHREDLVGAYIEELYRPGMGSTEKKALYYGVQALLGQKG